MKVAARVLVLALLSAHLVIGQTSPAIEHGSFSPSPDHFWVYCKSANGVSCRPSDSLIGWVISNYRARVYRVIGSARTLVFEKNLGRPYPDQFGRIGLNLSPEFDTLGPGQYVVAIVAEGPGGVSAPAEATIGNPALSAPSNLKVFP